MVVFLRSGLGVLAVALSVAMHGIAAAESAVVIDAASLVTAIRENAERLRAGEFVATGTFVERRFERDNNGRLTSKEPKEVNNYQESIACVFDFDNSRFSFRRQRIPMGGSRKQPNAVFHYVGLPHQSVLLQSKGDTRVGVRIHDPVFPKSDGRSLIQPVFDPRVMGFAGILKLHGRFEELFSHYFPDKPTILHKEGSGVWRLDRHTSIDKERGYSNTRSWWCDEDQGLQPVRYCLQMKLDEMFPGAALYNQKNECSQESEVTWSNVSGIWVPKTLNLFGVLNDSDVRLQLELDWRNVNLPISATAFDWRKWDLPKGTVIYDDRLHVDAPLIQAVIGQSLEVEFTPLQGNQKGKPMIRQLLILNTMILGAAIGYVAKKKLFKRVR